MSGLGVILKLRLKVSIQGDFETLHRVRHTRAYHDADDNFLESFKKPCGIWKPGGEYLLL